MQVLLPTEPSCSRAAVKCPFGQASFRCPLSWANIHRPSEVSWRSLPIELRYITFYRPLRWAAFHPFSIKRVPSAVACWAELFFLPFIDHSITCYFEDCCLFDEPIQTLCCKCEVRWFHEVSIPFCQTLLCSISSNLPIWIQNMITCPVEALIYSAVIAICWKWRNPLSQWHFEFDRVLQYYNRLQHVKLQLSFAYTLKVTSTSNVVSGPSSKRLITSTNRTPIVFSCHSYLFWNTLYPIKYAKQSWSIERLLLNGNLQRVATSSQLFTKFRLSRRRLPFQSQHLDIVFTDFTPFISILELSMLFAVSFLWELHIFRK